MQIHLSPLAIVVVAALGCSRTSPAPDAASYSDETPAFTREARPYAAPEGVYVYDFVGDEAGFVLLADWTDSSREPPSILGLLHLDPVTGDVVSSGVELDAPSSGGLLARTDGPLVAVVDGEAGVFAARFTLEDGVLDRFDIPLTHAYAAAVSEGQLYVAGIDRVACDGWRDWCPRMWSFDLDSGASAERSYPNVNHAIALLPAAGGVELLSAEAFGRYDRATETWATKPLPAPLHGFTRVSDAERLFFRADVPADSQPVLLDLDSGVWSAGRFEDAVAAPVRLSAEWEGQTWVLDAWCAEDGFTPTLSVVAAR